LTQQDGKERWNQLAQQVLKDQQALKDQQVLKALQVLKELWDQQAQQGDKGQ
jgi:hypothetical protein